MLIQHFFLKKNKKIVIHERHRVLVREIIMVVFNLLS